MEGLDRLIAFVGVTDAGRAKAFYGDVLGLRLLHEDQFAAVYQVGGIMLRVSLVGKNFVPACFTVLGWKVDDIRAAVDALAARGVAFERFGFFDQDERGIWAAPDGDQVAWFKDPDGNILSVTQFAGTLAPS